MTTIYHDPLALNAQLSSRILNIPFSQLDTALHGVLFGDTPWAVRSTDPSAPASGYSKLYFIPGALVSQDSTGFKRGQPGDLVRLTALTELSGSQATIPLTISTSLYSHLTLKLRLRTDAGAVLDQVLVQFNGDTTAANYNTSSFDGSTNNTAVGTVSGVKIWSVPGASADANLFGLVDPLHVFNYASTTRAKVVDWRGVCIPSTSVATNYRALMGGGLWTNTTNAVTSITLKPVTGSNFVAGSAYEVFGVI